ncbi:MAG: hypothetical protein AAGI53_17430 [Planctomycetota bacterium]
MPSFQRLVCLTCGVFVSTAYAQFQTPSAYGWERGVSDMSTFAEWEFFSSPAGPNSPGTNTVVGDLPEDAPAFNAFDFAFETSGSFITSGGNIYSFSGIVSPETTSPGFAMGYGYKTSVLFQVQTLGVEPDPESFVLNGRREPIEVVEIATGDVGGPFGGLDVTTLVRFEFARNDLANSVFFEAIGTSLSFDQALIDTFTEPMDCSVDLDLSGSVDFFDTIEILKDVDALDGDWNGDGSTTPADTLDFVAAVETGCDP